MTLEGSGKKGFGLLNCEFKFTPRHAPHQEGLVLLGNKADLPYQKVTTAEMKQISQKLGAVDSILTSAKTGQGVQKAFVKLRNAIFNRLQAKPA